MVSKKILTYLVILVNTILILAFIFVFLGFNKTNLLINGTGSLSLVLILLTLIIFHSIFLYGNQFVVFAYREHTLALLLLEGCVLTAFITDNILLFYFFFESLIFPMFFLIGIWGSRGRRVHAAFQFVFFTVASSILLLTGILVLYLVCGTIHFTELGLIEIRPGVQYVLALLFFFGFATKIPSLPLHIWLPEAHVEAPTIGSVILAAILLKFGFYGIVRLVIPICSSDVFLNLTPLFYSVFLISLVYSSVTALRQIDLKRIIAYSSVAHMNFAMLGIFTESEFGLIGTTFLMLSHGIISGAMFFAIGLMYERFHVRNIIYFGGLVQFMPIFSSFFLIIMFGNMSLPGTCNFVGEFAVFLSIYNSGVILFVVSVLSVVLVSLFSLVVLSRTIFYQITGFLYPIYDLNFCEVVLFVVFPFYIILLGLYPDIITTWL